MAYENVVFTVPRYAELISLVDGSLLFRLEQMVSATISHTETETPVLGANGVPMTILKSGKSVTITSSTSEVAFDALGAQLGSDATVGTITVPTTDILDIVGGVATVPNVVIGPAGAEIPFIYSVSGGRADTFNKFAIATTADATHFSFDPVTNEITPPTGFTGTQLAVRYDTQSNDSVTIVNNSTTFSKSGKLVTEWYAQDICTKETVIVKIIAPQATCSGVFDLVADGTGSAHDVTLNILSNVCSPLKDLYYAYILGENGYVPFTPNTPVIVNPTLTSATPSTDAEAGGASITLAGTGFATGATVSFGANAATNVVVTSATEITCTAPAGTGTVNITVTNTDTGSSQETVNFVYT